MLDINPPPPETAKKHGPNATFYQTDVASYASQAEAFAGVCKQPFPLPLPLTPPFLSFTLTAHGSLILIRDSVATYDRIDAVCLNAGIVDRTSVYRLDSPPITPDTPLQIPSEPDLSATDIDLKGVIYGIRLATHFMRYTPADSNGFGKKIVITASIAGLAPHPALPEYSAAKAGVVAYVRAVAPVLKEKEGIAISALGPGLAATAVLPTVVVDAVGQSLLTSVEAIVRAYEAFLDIKGLGAAGEVREVVGEASDVVVPARVQTHMAREMYVAVMEPIFQALHGESGPNAEGLF